LVYANDELVATTDTDSEGVWSVVFQIPTGEVLRVEVSSLDAAGNESSRSLYGYILADTQPPTIAVLSPENGSFTDETAVVLTAHITDDTTRPDRILVTITAPGIPAQQISLSPDSTGRVAVSLRLVDGANLISISAMDEVGNTRVVRIILHRGSALLGTLAVLIPLIVGGTLFVLVFEREELSRILARSKRRKRGKKRRRKRA
jgi:hypothetical protein